MQLSFKLAHWNSEAWLQGGQIFHRLGDCLLLAVFLIKEVAQILGLLFPPVKVIY
jgi:hypothetical protein